MLFSAVACLAIASLAAAAPAAQATYCSEDNLLRAFQHTPTPASKYCTTTTGYPTFLAVTSYPATRLSSACSCFSRFPIDSALPTPTPACTPGTVFAFSGTGVGLGTTLNIVVTTGSQTCSDGNVLVTNVCGTYNGKPVSFNPADGGVPTADCLVPSLGFFSVYFRSSTGDLLYFVPFIAGFIFEDLTAGTLDFFLDIPSDVSCTSAAQCPK